MHEDITWLKENSVTKGYLENRLETERKQTRKTVREETTAIIRKETKSIVREETRKVVQDETSKLIREALNLNNQVLGTIFKVELAEFRQEIVKALKIGFEEIAKQFKQDRGRIDELELHTGL